MRIYFVISCVLLTFFSGIAGRNIAAQNDETYDVPLIRGLLQHPEGLGLSFYEKRLNRLGDRVSIALLKILEEEELDDPQKVKIFLPLIRTSFSFPSLILISEDRKPKVTLFFLKHLEGKTQDSKVKAEISQLIKFVKDKTDKIPAQP
jgi:hypothetical protein